MPSSVSLVNLDLVPYAQALALQHRLVSARKHRELNDTLLLLEHPPVFTLGRNAREEHILASTEYLDQIGIEVFRVERGGDVTYHGPGQLVGYPILDLHNYRTDIGWYVRRLEDVLVRVVTSFGLNARRIGDDGRKRDSKLVGVWVDNPVADPLTRRLHPDAKIAQIGARIESWVTYHGFALNVDPILPHFDLIVPCGIPDKPVTSLSQALGRPAPMQDVRTRIALAFEQVFDISLEETSLESLDQEATFSNIA